MRDMFHNYDYHIDKKDYPFELPPEETERLETNPNVRIIKDIKGRELGIRAYCNSTFRLYFLLDNIVDTNYLESLLSTGIIKIEIFKQHKLVFEKLLSNDIQDNTIIADLTTSSQGPLKIGTYTMRVSITTDTEQHIIFYEDDGYLDIV